MGSDARLTDRGPVAPSPTRELAFDLPLLSLMIETNDPQAVSAAVSRLVNALVQQMNFQLLRSGKGNLLRTETLKHGRTAIHGVALGDFARTQTKCEYFHTLHLAWATTDNAGRDLMPIAPADRPQGNPWLILSTHPDHIRQILDARAGRAQHLSSASVFAALGSRERTAASIVLAQPAEAARLVQSWIDYLRVRHPHMLQPDWWRHMQRRSDQARVTLGAGLQDDAAHPGQVRVVRTLPGWPAHGKLQEGDRIVGLDGRGFSVVSATKDLKRAIAQRRDPEQVVLQVERNGEAMEVTIKLSGTTSRPAPTFDPVGALQQLAQLGGAFSGAGYMVSEDDPHRFHAELVLQFSRTTRPPISSTR